MAGAVLAADPASRAMAWVPRDMGQACQGRAPAGRGRAPVVQTWARACRARAGGDPVTMPGAARARGTGVSTRAMGADGRVMGEAPAGGSRTQASSADWSDLAPWVGPPWAVVGAGSFSRRWFAARGSLGIVALDDHEHALLARSGRAKGRLVKVQKQRFQGVLGYPKAWAAKGVDSVHVVFEPIPRVSPRWACRRRRAAGRTCRCAGPRGSAARPA